MNVQLVVIGQMILGDISDDVVKQLSKCATEVPFILLENENSLEVYERICAHRVKFEWETHPLAKMLEGAGVETNWG